MFTANDPTDANRQAVRPLLGAYAPAPHGNAETKPEVLANVPAGQIVQLDWPKAEEKKPGWHATGAVAPVVLEQKPNGAEAHAVDAGDAENRPKGHKPVGEESLLALQ